MGLFDNVNLSVTTKYGTASVTGGKLGLDMGGGLSPATPTPLTPARPQPATAGSLMTWVKNHTGLVALAAAGLLALILLRR